MLRYNEKTIGTFTLVQQRKDEANPRKYKIQSVVRSTFAHVSRGKTTLTMYCASLTAKARCTTQSLVQ